MRIFVTGYAGFIGSHIVEHFKDDDVVFDNLRYGFEKNIKFFLKKHWVRRIFIKFQVELVII